MNAFKRSPAPLVSVLGAGLFAEGETSRRVARPRPMRVGEFAFEAAASNGEARPLGGQPGPATRFLNRMQPGESPLESAARLSGLLSVTLVQIETGDSARR